MPPGVKLPAAVIQEFETWIVSGAVDPRGGGAVPTQRAVDLVQGRTFWEFPADSIVCRARRQT